MKKVPHKIIYRLMSFAAKIAQVFGFCSVPTIQFPLVDRANYMSTFSYTLSREYRVVRDRYSRLLFTSEDRLCANLLLQEQPTNITSQCQCLTFA